MNFPAFYTDNAEKSIAGKSLTEDFLWHPTAEACGKRPSPNKIPYIPKTLASAPRKEIKSGGREVGFIGADQHLLCANVEGKSAAIFLSLNGQYVFLNVGGPDRVGGVIPVIPGASEGKYKIRINGLTFIDFDRDTVVKGFCFINSPNSMGATATIATDYIQALDDLFTSKSHVSLASEIVIWTSTESDVAVTTSDIGNTLATSFGHYQRISEQQPASKPQPKPEITKSNAPLQEFKPGVVRFDLDSRDLENAPIAVAQKHEIHLCVETLAVLEKSQHWPILQISENTHFTGVDRRETGIINADANADDLYVKVGGQAAAVFILISPLGSNNKTYFLYRTEHPDDLVFGDHMATDLANKIEADLKPFFQEQYVAKCFLVVGATDDQAEVKLSEVYMDNLSRIFERSTVAGDTLIMKWLSKWGSVGITVKTSDRVQATTFGLCHPLPNQIRQPGSPATHPHNDPFHEPEDNEHLHDPFIIQQGGEDANLNFQLLRLDTTASEAKFGDKPAADDKIEISVENFAESAETETRIPFVPETLRDFKKVEGVWSDRAPVRKAVDKSDKKVSDKGKEAEKLDIVIENLYVTGVTGNSAAIFLWFSPPEPHGKYAFFCVAKDANELFQFTKNDTIAAYLNDEVIVEGFIMVRDASVAGSYINALNGILRSSNRKSRIIRWISASGDAAVTLTDSDFAVATTFGHYAPEYRPESKPSKPAAVQKVVGPLPFAIDYLDTRHSERLVNFRSLKDNQICSLSVENYVKPQDDEIPFIRRSQAQKLGDPKKPENRVIDGYIGDPALFKGAILPNYYFSGITGECAAVFLEFINQGANTSTFFFCKARSVADLRNYGNSYYVKDHLVKNTTTIVKGFFMVSDTVQDEEPSIAVDYLEALGDILRSCGRGSRITQWISSRPDVIVTSEVVSKTDFKDEPKAGESEADKPKIILSGKQRTSVKITYGLYEQEQAAQKPSENFVSFNSVATEKNNKGFQPGIICFPNVEKFKEPEKGKIPVVLPDELAQKLAQHNVLFHNLPPRPVFGMLGSDPMETTAIAGWLATGVTGKTAAVFLLFTDIDTHQKGYFFTRPQSADVLSRQFYDNDLNKLNQKNILVQGFCMVSGTDPESDSAYRSFLSGYFNLYSEEADKQHFKEISRTRGDVFTGLLADNIAATAVGQVAGKIKNAVSDAASQTAQAIGAAASSAGQAISTAGNKVAKGASDMVSAVGDAADSAGTYLYQKLALNIQLSRDIERERFDKKEPEVKKSASQHDEQPQPQQQRTPVPDPRVNIIFWTAEEGDVAVTLQAFDSVPRTSFGHYSLSRRYKLPKPKSIQKAGSLNIYDLDTTKVDDQVDLRKLTIRNQPIAAFAPCVLHFGMPEEGIEIPIIPAEVTKDGQFSKAPFRTHGRFDAGFTNLWVDCVGGTSAVIFLVFSKPDNAERDFLLYKTKNVNELTGYLKSDMGPKIEGEPVLVQGLLVVSGDNPESDKAYITALGKIFNWQLLDQSGIVKWTSKKNTIGITVTTSDGVPAGTFGYYQPPAAALSALRISTTDAREYEKEYVTNEMLLRDVDSEGIPYYCYSLVNRYFGNTLFIPRKEVAGANFKKIVVRETGIIGEGRTSHPNLYATDIKGQSAAIFLLFISPDIVYQDEKGNRSTSWSWDPENEHKPVQPANVTYYFYRTNSVDDLLHYYNTELKQYCKPNIIVKGFYMVSNPDVAKVYNRALTNIFKNNRRIVVDEPLEPWGWAVTARELYLRAKKIIVPAYGWPSEGVLGMGSPAVGGVEPKNQPQMATSSIRYRAFWRLVFYTLTSPLWIAGGVAQALEEPVTRAYRATLKPLGKAIGGAVNKVLDKGIEALSPPGADYSYLLYNQVTRKYVPATEDYIEQLPENPAETNWVPTSELLEWISEEGDVAVVLEQNDNGLPITSFGHYLKVKNLLEAEIDPKIQTYDHEVIPRDSSQSPITYVTVDTRQDEEQIVDDSGLDNIVESKFNASKSEFLCYPELLYPVSKVFQRPDHGKIPFLPNTAVPVKGNRMVADLKPNMNNIYVDGIVNNAAAIFIFIHDPVKDVWKLFVYKTKDPKDLAFYDPQHNDPKKFSDQAKEIEKDLEPYRKKDFIVRCLLVVSGSTEAKFDKIVNELTGGYVTALSDIFKNNAEGSALVFWKARIPNAGVTLNTENGWPSGIIGHYWGKFAGTISKVQPQELRISSAKSFGLHVIDINNTVTQDKPTVSNKFVSILAGIGREGISVSPNYSPVLPLGTVAPYVAAPVKPDPAHFPDGTRYEQIMKTLPPSTVPDISVSEFHNFKKVVVGQEWVKGSFTMGKGGIQGLSYPGLFTARVTGNSAAVYINIINSDKPGYFLFCHTTDLHDMNKCRDLVTSLIEKDSIVRAVIMVNGSVAILGKYVTALQNICYGAEKILDGVDTSPLGVADKNWYIFAWATKANDRGCNFGVDIKTGLFGSCPPEFFSPMPKQDKVPQQLVEHKKRQPLPPAPVPLPGGNLSEASDVSEDPLNSDQDGNKSSQNQDKSKPEPKPEPKPEVDPKPEKPVPDLPPLRGKTRLPKSLQTPRNEGEDDKEIELKPMKPVITSTTRKSSESDSSSDSIDGNDNLIKPEREVTFVEPNKPDKTGKGVPREKSVGLESSFEGDVSQIESPPKPENKKGQLKTNVVGPVVITTNSKPGKESDPKPSAKGGDMSGKKGGKPKQQLKPDPKSDELKREDSTTKVDPSSAPKPNSSSQTEPKNFGNDKGGEHF